jgi:peptide/nickel transport system permease protein
MTVQKKNLAPQAQPLQAASATKQAQLADVGGTTMGTSGITAVPGSITANDSAQPLSGATAAVPRAAMPEATRDDNAEASTRARWRMPNWFNVLWSNSKARIGLVLLLMFFLVAILAPLIAPYDPSDTSFMPAMQPDGTHLLGTTQAGQDVLSQLIWGTRVSLLVGALAGGLATLIALIIGMTAGYMQGIVDDVLSFFINLALVIPTLPLMIALAAYAPVRGLSLTILVIGITGWAWGARMKRAQVISLRAREYITSAKFAGERPMRIIFREVMPNMMSFVVMSFIGAANGAIGAEAGLAFLGLGDPNTISWGTMLYWANNGGAMLTGQWAWLAAPTLMLALITLSLTLINFGVDALSNPHLREE